MEATRDLLSQLQAWYLAHYDGDWEHGNGVSISTPDNPGWSIEIALMTPIWGADCSIVSRPPHRR
jgi:hypothetical protein